ncbi:hypothetical protein [Ulvibacterium sp.]|uniref:hypothetical protein n=1 Tax=Ulvibacterium sp. TaxID=2665914 RepID=UPI00261134B3|nr:hypothetical protein [Ulvibacterium sp.]
MKSILTLLIVLLFGAMALAQNTQTDVKVESIEMGVVLDGSLAVPVATFQGTQPGQDQVARLYKFRNSRVKKALSFRTKKNKAKLA